jgi:hypothetical protein
MTRLWAAEPAVLVAFGPSLASLNAAWLAVDDCQLCLSFDFFFLLLFLFNFFIKRRVLMAILIQNFDSGLYYR